MKCVYHALRLWYQKGGYLWIRASKFCHWIPHFGWAKDVVDAEHWQPDKPVTGWKVVFHKLWAKGRVKPGK